MILKIYWFCRNLHVLLTCFAINSQCLPDSVRLFNRRTELFMSVGRAIRKQQTVDHRLSRVKDDVACCLCVRVSRHFPS